MRVTHSGLGGRRLAALLLSVAAAASCRLGYDESASTIGTGNTGGVGGAANGGNSSAGSADVGGSSPIDAGASSTLAGAGGESTLPAAGRGGDDTGGLAGVGPGGGGLGSGGTDGNGGSGGAACTSTIDCTCQEFQGRDYWFCTNSTNWEEAEAQCGLASMSLVRIDSQAENDFVIDRGTPLGVFNVNGFAQIGANDQAVDGEWRWTDGTQLWAGDATGSPVDGAFANWIAGSPSAGGIKNCSGILLAGTWQDRSCTAVVPSICESP